MQTKIVMAQQTKYPTLLTDISFESSKSMFSFCIKENVFQK